MAMAAEEGRGHAAKCLGEALAAWDPRESEWGNPVGARPITRFNREGTAGSETSEYREEKRRFP